MLLEIVWTYNQLCNMQISHFLGRAEAGVHSVWLSLLAFEKVSIPILISIPIVILIPILVPIPIPKGEGDYG